MNALYQSAKTYFLTGVLSWTSGTLRVLAVNTTNYSVNLAQDTFLNSIPANAIVSTSAPLVNATVVSGAANANAAEFSNVNGTINALVIYSDTGSAASSPLIAYIDTATGLPISCTANTLTIQWDAGQNKIFAI